MIAVAAARKTPLTVVPAGAKPKRQARPKSITQAAATGTERELLVALRARIAESVQNVSTPPRDLAALSRRLREIDKDIRAIDAAVEEEAESADVEDEAFDSSTL